ncbi:MAG: hypothetical protein QNJ38_23935 [Prochloraceae cyanobacterium]|nr:hypothetical protein [Prochloraceae cyanobacterium]
MIIWQAYSNNPNNADNLAKIGQWWQDLNDKEVIFAHRPIPANGNLGDIDWNHQKFDEKFVICKAQIRGITLYWQKSAEKSADRNTERNLTPRRLELDRESQQLDIYPQSQDRLVVRVSTPEIAYQSVELENPLIVGTSVENKCILLLRDRIAKVQVKVTLNAESLAQLLENLPQ